MLSSDAIHPLTGFNTRNDARSTGIDLYTHIAVEALKSLISLRGGADHLIDRLEISKTAYLMADAMVATANNNDKGK